MRNCFAAAGAVEDAVEDAVEGAVEDAVEGAVEDAVEGAVEDAAMYARTRIKWFSYATKGSKGSPTVQ
jgi:hypothetical protein